MNYFKRKGQLYSSPEPGDVIFFWNSAKKEASHVGIVEKVDSSYVYTIEGNTSNKSGVVANGGAVASKKYNLANSRIAGYGRPDYCEANTNDGLDKSESLAVNSNSNEEMEIMYIGTATVSPNAGSSVNFRRSPSKSASRISDCPVISAGETVNIKSVDGAWASIEYLGHQGYMMTEFLEMTMFDGFNHGSEQQHHAANNMTVDQITAEIITLINQLSQMAK